MQDFKGTPGPWHVSNENALRIRDDQSFVTVATAEYVTNEEELATAYLIAAAPELLEALQLALNAMNEMGDILNFNDLAEQSKVDELTPAFDKARSAINKALGK
uniref:Uncharacterized protein n=1 Tax=Klebsiella pneumoniae TaxID=573 RepID=A0A483LRH6_KLEPN